MHIQGVSCAVRWLDKKQNKPVWSGKGSSEIKRFKAPFAHEYLMPIWGQSQWSSVRSSRCWRKSTLSASGYFSTVSYVKVQPHSCYAAAVSIKYKRFYSFSTVCGLIFFLLRLSQNIVSDSYFMQKAETAPLCESANTRRYWTIVSDLASESSAQLYVGSKVKQIKISSWQSQANLVVKWPQPYFDTQAWPCKASFLWTSRIIVIPLKKKKKPILALQHLSSVLIVAIWKHIAWLWICHCKKILPPSDKIKPT